MQTDKEYAIQLAMEYGFTGGFNSQGILTYDSEFVEAVLEAIAKEREKWKEIVEGQRLRLQALNEIIGGEGSTTTGNILSYSRWEMRIEDAVKEEREACLKICESQASTNYWEGADVCAEAIRARAKEERLNNA